MFSPAVILEAARSPELQLLLTLVPIYGFEHHAALEHLSLEIGRGFFHSGVSLTLNLGSPPCRSIASSAANAPRTASYIMVRLSFVNAW